MVSITKSSCFFFQAEDGIRDLVRSRGLGDVYKRQNAFSALCAKIGEKEQVVAIAWTLAQPAVASPIVLSLIHI